MLMHPGWDPIAFQIGPVAVRWYGLMYLLAFLLFYLFGRWRLAHSWYGKRTGLTAKDLEDLLFYGVLGVIVGGRLGYVLFYKPGDFLANPLSIFAVWTGGMSFHGGLIGVIVALAWFARRRGVPYLDIGDFVAPLVPLGLAAGRFANFINGELWGRVTDLPWAMVFPQAHDNLPRHPSQLYQMAGEGLLLFVVLWWFSSRPRPRGAVSGLFLIGYGLLRFLAEFAREPDAFLGKVLGPFTMGQLLCVPMLIAGVWLLSASYRTGRGDGPRAPVPPA